jgi:aspartyl-tRNA(Asn)/glutamyl-tRNA(Gln) amidotransferase subunit A
VGDAVIAHEILAARTVTRSTAPLSGYRFAVARTVMLDSLEPAVAQAFERTLQAFRAAGAQVEEIALSEINELAAINATGGFSAAESYALHRELITAHQAQYDPRVAARILRGAPMHAHDYIDLVNARRRWIAKMEAALSRFDAVLSPTVPIVAPPIAQVAPGEQRDAEFFRVNALLLRNTSVVNMLDGCAISIPCHAPGELPVGLMMWHGALRDDTILNAALEAEKLLRAA